MQAGHANIGKNLEAGIVIISYKSNTEKESLHL